MTAQGRPRFQAGPRARLRSRKPWNRIGYIAGALPAAIADMAASLQVPPAGQVLDYGAADSPYRDLFAAGVGVVAADLPGNSSADLTLNEDGSIPVPDETFDAVLSTQVLEHVTDPETYLSECFRVLRPGGRLLLSTHGIMVYHPDPDDYWRWTCAGLERAVQAPGFELIRFEGVMGLAATGVQLFQDALYWKLPGPIRPAFAVACQTLIRLLDTLQGPESKRMNALVFVLVAAKP